MAALSRPLLAAVGVPTYKRQDKLERLLLSLEPSLRERPARVLVADNACEEATRALVERFARRWPHTRYIPVPARGISANRNALIAAFLDDAPEPWLAMVDDDLHLGPGWLAAMLDTGERHGADVVGAPYAIVQPTGRYVVDQSVFIKRARPPSGPCAPIAAAGNILLALSMLVAEPPLRFDDAYGLSGGEDYDFFARAAARGARFAWCDEAFAEEDVDTARLNARAVFWRYYSSGNYMAVIDRAREGAGPGWRRQVPNLFKAFGIVGHGAVKRDRDRMTHGIFMTLLTLGALAALAGARVYRYR